MNYNGLIIFSDDKGPYVNRAFSMEEVSIDSDVITVDSNENTETRKDRRVPNVEIQIGDTQFVKKYFNFTFQLMFLSLDNPTFDRTA